MANRLALDRAAATLYGTASFRVGTRAEDIRDTSLLKCSTPSTSKARDYIRVHLLELENKQFVCSFCSRKVRTNRNECITCPGVYSCGDCVKNASLKHPHHSFQVRDTASKVAAARAKQRPEAVGDADDDGMWYSVPQDGCPTCFDRRPGQEGPAEFDLMRTQGHWLSYHDIFPEDLRLASERGCQLCSLIYRGLAALLRGTITEGSIRIHIHPEVIMVGFDNQARRFFSADIVLSPRDGFTSPWGSMALALNLSRRFDSTGCFDQLRKWLETCERAHEHPRCKQRTPFPQLPGRLLHVGDGSDPCSLRLVVTAGLEVDYIALSHCWGRKVFEKTTRENYQKFQTSIDEQTLPKSFRDAIACARQVGTSYVWIDSLCIIQDDSMDWERESAKMCDVYENARLVIVAASASGAEAGFLGQRPLEYAGVPFESEEGSGRLDFVAQRLMEHRYGYTASRAWCLQETVLARRCVFFSKDEMIWECNSLNSCECGCNDSLSIRDDLAPGKPGCFLGRHHDTSPATKSTRPFQDFDSAEKLYDEWRLRVVLSFTKMALTRPTDRLPALSGFAAIVARQCRDEYLAGIWLSDLPLGLLWHTDTLYEKPLQKAPLEYFGPSFSWVSIGRSVIYAYPSRFPDGSRFWKALPMTVHDARCNVPGLNPFGAVTGGHIRLSGLLKPAVLRCKVHKDLKPTYSLDCEAITKQYFFMPDTYLIESRVGGKTATTTATRAKSDLPSKDFEAQVDLLLVAETSWKPEIWPDRYKRVFTASLVLGLSVSQPETFERLGVFQVQSDPENDAVLDYTWADGFEPREITII